LSKNLPPRANSNEIFSTSLNSIYEVRAQGWLAAALRTQFNPHI